MQGKKKPTRVSSITANAFKAWARVEPLDGTNPWTRALTPEEYPPYDLQKKPLDVTA